MTFLLSCGQRVSGAVSIVAGDTFYNRPEFTHIEDLPSLAFTAMDSYMLPG
jgi:hypothetical protein